MKVLVLNSGSSSLKFQVINLKNNKCELKGQADGIGLKTSMFLYNLRGNKIENKVGIKDHVNAVKYVFEAVKELCDLKEIAAIGHRVVHGGEKYSDAVKIDANVIKTIDKLSELAPLHNPPNLAGIKACKKVMPKVPQVAVFDTAFHQTLPAEAYMYAIPYKFYQKNGIRKYGFHGTSHKYVMLQAAKLLRKKTGAINCITCHLGNGSSLAAIKSGKSVDTSMGLTPLQGLVMGTRSGDLDPALVEVLAGYEKTDAAGIVKMLNKQSGLKGICGESDVRTIHEKAKKGDKRCKLALEMFAYRVSSYIGSYMANLPKVDAIIFTAGIGQQAFYLRKMISKNLENIGVKLDAKKNSKNELVISDAKSKVKVLVIPTNEELMIAQETKKVLKLK